MKMGLKIMLTSNVPNILFTEDGIIVPTAAEVLTGVLKDFSQVFGGNMRVDLRTPQGQLASSLAAIITSKNNEIALLVNQINPEYADGFFQDAIGEIYFLPRKPGTATRVTCTVTGLPGTVIPANTLAKDTVGNIYTFISVITIPSTGTTTAILDNIQTGEIACAANTLTVIYQTVNGWDSITNPNAGVPGIPVENRQKYEYRRKQSVAANATGTIAAIRANVFKIPEIIEVYGVDNVTSEPIIITGVTLVPHSLYICAYAKNWTLALREKVAAAIFDKKDLGCDYNGDTVITIYDGIAYNVRFQEAQQLSVFFRINIRNNPALPNTIASQIQNAILTNFDEKIGSLIEANTFYGTILAVDPRIQIISVFVGNTANPSTLQLQATIEQMPITALNNIIVDLA